jgi:hypothetical protein
MCPDISGDDHRHDRGGFRFGMGHHFLRLWSPKSSKFYRKSIKSSLRSRVHLQIPAFQKPVDRICAMGTGNDLNHFLVKTGYNNQWLLFTTCFGVF